MRTLTLPAPAKLNLFLHITGRRPDGYHDLQTVFQLLDYGDELQFEARDGGELSLACSGHVPGGLAPRDNLVLRAAERLRDAAGEAQHGAAIRLHKRLPAGGGLGGGSSDAASTLLGLNALWDLRLPAQALAELGAGLGADVPVFVRGHSAWAEGTGERLQPLALPPRWYLVLHPGCHVATGAVFSHPELTRDSRPITMAAFFAGDTRNDCERLVRQLAEPVDKALRWLQNFGEARLTGTGACVYAAYRDEATARRVLEQVPEPWSAFVAAGVERSPALTQLQRSGAQAH